MRVALLSSTEIIPDADGLLRAFARIGGRTVLARQLDFAIGMGCERIACLSHGLPPELIDLQHEAESAGVKFQVIRDFRPLSGLVRAVDELLIVSDGLVMDPVLAAGLLDDGKRAVLTLSAAEAIPEGFERLDSQDAWAGIFLASGALIEQLADLPPDIDPQSSLLRLALQSGAKTKRIDPAALSDRKWIIANNSQKLKSFEDAWLEEASDLSSFASPVSAAADRAAMAVLRRHNSPDTAKKAVGSLGYFLMAAAVMCGYFTYPIVGLFAVSIAAFAVRFSLTMSSVTEGPHGRTKGGNIITTLPPVLVDLVLVFLVLASASPVGMGSALFAVLMLVGLLRLSVAPKLQPSVSMIGSFLQDRGVLAVAFAALLAFGHLVAGLQIIAGLLLLLLILQTYAVKLTRA